MKKVSIIVPIYNVENYLDRCIKSLIGQTYNNLEIILVNDGSPDNCKDICEKYAKADNRIVLFNNENRGCSYSRNFGLLKSTGDYILFVDSDDYIEKDLVEIAVKVAEENNADIVAFDILSVDETNNRRVVLSSDMPCNTDVSIEKYPNILNAVPAAYNKLMLRELWEKNDITFPVGRRYEDLEAMSKIMAVAKKIRYYNEKPLYYYVFRQGSFVKSSFTPEKYDDILTAIDSVEVFYKQKNLYDSLKEEFEFYNTMHAFFYPSKELVSQKNVGELLEKIRENIFEKYPDFQKNKYLSTLSKSDTLLFKLLVKQQYGLMNMLSEGRTKIAKIIGR